MKIENLTEEKRLELLDYLPCLPINERSKLTTRINEILVKNSNKYRYYCPKYCFIKVPAELQVKPTDTDGYTLQVRYSYLMRSIEKFKSHKDFLVSIINAESYDYKSLANVLDYIAYEVHMNIIERESKLKPIGPTDIAYENLQLLHFIAFELFPYKVEAAELCMESDCDISTDDKYFNLVSHSFITLLLGLLQKLWDLYVNQNDEHSLSEKIKYGKKIAIASFMIIHELNLTKNYNVKEFFADVFTDYSLISVINEYDNKVEKLKTEDILSCISILTEDLPEGIVGPIISKYNRLLNEKKTKIGWNSNNELLSTKSISTEKNGWLVFGDTITDSDNSLFDLIMLVNQIDDETIRDYMSQEYDNETIMFMISPENLMYIKECLQLPMCTFRKEEISKVVLLYEGEQYLLYHYLGDGNVYGISLHEDKHGNRNIITIEKDEETRYKLVISDLEEIGKEV